MQIYEDIGVCKNKEVILFVTSPEAKIIHEAIKEYAEKYKRKKKIKALFDKLESDLDIY